MIQSIVKPERKYIGSAVSFAGRKAVHISQLENGNHHSKKLQRHAVKYSIKDLVFHILEIVSNKEDLLGIEQKYLSNYLPYFNICCTAGSRLGLKSGPMSEAHKVKISVANKGKRKSAECVEKHYVKMHKYSIDGELLKTYDSGKHAQKAEGLQLKSFGKRNITIGGFVWVSDSLPVPDFDKIKQRKIESKKVLCRAVLQISKQGEIVAEHEGVRLAWAATGIDHRSIAQVAAGSLIRKTAGGYLWKYKK